MKLNGIGGAVGGGGGNGLGGGLGGGGGGGTYQDIDLNAWLAGVSVVSGFASRCNCASSIRGNGCTGWPDGGMD